jgi:hypothetical protein
VQNAVWAREFLFAKYGIGTGPNEDHFRSHHKFSKWARYEKPQRRAGHPVPNAKAFKVDKVPSRNVWRTGFGLDYLRYFPPGYMGELSNNDPNSTDSLPAESVDDFKLLELNKWADDDGLSYSAHGYDVYVQRLSLYVQRNMECADLWDASRRASIHLDNNSDAGSMPESDAAARQPVDSPSDDFDNGKPEPILLARKCVDCSRNNAHCFRVEPFRIIY